MPAVSKAQFRFMQGVAHGSIKAKSLTPAKAAEYVSGQHPASLPERVLQDRSTKGSPPYTAAELARGYRRLP